MDKTSAQNRENTRRRISGGAYFFTAAGLPMPDQKLYTYKEDMTFVNPSMTVRLRQHVPQDKREIKMERRHKIQALRAFIGHHDAQRDHLFHVCARQRGGSPHRRALF